LLRRGFELHQKNEYSAAISVLRNAWKLRQQDYFANLLLGIDLLRTGQSKGSISYLREAARQKPGDEFAYEYLGEAYATLQRHAEAFVSFRRAIEAAPESTEAKTSFVGYCMARFADLSDQMRSSKPGLAAEYRLQALSRPRSDPSRVELLQRAAALVNDAENWIQLALTQIGDGDLAAGREALERARKLSPADLGVMEAEALLAAEEGDWFAAAKFLDSIAARSPGALARILPHWPAEYKPTDNSRISGPAALFFDCVANSCDSQTLLQRFPKSTEVPHSSAAILYREQRWENLTHLEPPANDQTEQWFQQGVAWAELGDCERAIPALDSNLAPKAIAGQAMFHLSWCYAEQAGRVAAQLSKSSKNDAVVHLMRGDVLFRLQANSQGAVAEYQAAVDVRPDDPAGWERLAAAQLAAGSTQDARRSAQQALKRDTHRMPAMRTLAGAAMQERNYVDALPFLRELVKHNPKDLAIRVQLATACSQTGELLESLQNLDSVLRQGYPDEKGGLHYQLGTILRRLGRVTEANHAFTEAKELSDRFQNTSLQPGESKQ
jgi:tetratricopeptide (TPR) repeat protein